MDMDGGSGNATTIVGWFDSQTVSRSRSSTDPSREWVVVRQPSGHVRCTCPGWRYHGHCKHVSAFVSAQVEELLVCLGVQRRAAGGGFERREP